MLHEGYLHSLLTDRCLVDVRHDAARKSDWKIVKYVINRRPHSAYAKFKHRTEFKSYPLTKRVKHTLSLRRPGRVPP